MSEKSPSVADIWNKHYATQEAFTKAMYKFRNQTLADVEKIIDLVDKENGWEENPVTKHRAILVLTLQERLKEEIKKIQSPESLSEELSLNKDNPAEVSKDTNTQNIHTGGAQSTGGLTGGEVKSEETYNGVNSQKPVICKPEPLCPPANTQNLKGCGKYIEDMDGVCGIDGLCEKCRGKDNSNLLDEKSQPAVCEGCGEEEKNCTGVYMECIKERGEA